MSKKRPLDSIRKEYEMISPAATRMHAAMQRHIEESLQAEGVQLALPIEARVKTLDSVLGKIGSGKVDAKKLKRLDDLVGLRLIVYFNRDIDPVCNALTNLFTVKKERNRAECLSPIEFGYQSIHYTVELPSTLLELPEFEGCFGLLAEIQVRTLAQHCWASVSHKLHYKSEESVANSIKRPLHRAAALLELIDLEFERLLESRDEYRRSAVYEPDDALLNVDNLETLLRDRFPHQRHWLDVHDISHILKDLLHFSIDTRGKLSNLISYHEAHIPRNSESTPMVLDEFGDPDFMDESPDTAILTLLFVEFPEKFREFQNMKAIEAFKDIVLSEFEPEPR